MAQLTGAGGGRGPTETSARRGAPLRRWGRGGVQRATRAAGSGNTPPGNGAPPAILSSTTEKTLSETTITALQPVHLSDFRYCGSSAVQVNSSVTVSDHALLVVWSNNKQAIAALVKRT